MKKFQAICSCLLTLIFTATITNAALSLTSISVFVPYGPNLPLTPSGGIVIPPGGFTAPLPLNVTFNFTNGSDEFQHVTDYHITLWDIDISFNDPLGTYENDITQINVAPGNSGLITILIVIPVATLNSAVGLFEGDELELDGTGYLTYYTAEEPQEPPPKPAPYQTGAKPIPEPTTALLMSLFCLMRLLNRRRS